MSTDEPKPRPDFAPRPIRSYVLRTGRMTPGQEKALREEWSRYGVDAPAQPLSSAGLFARQAPITLEVGFGMGDSLFATAASQPERNFIGVEVHKPGVGHLLHLAAKTGLDNLRVFHDDSLAVLEQYLQPGELDTLQIFFPDPWHKKRHHKRRLLNDEFMMLALRQLRPGGILHVATD